ncbi:MAG: TonB-dependent receptor plug domain-containing protein [Tsuneonella sp.]
MRSLAAIGVSAFALATAASAQAQDATTTDTSSASSTSNANDTADGAAIVVTGSRIALPQYSQPNPIVSADAATIEESGYTNLTDFLVQSPALIGSQTSVLSAGSNLLNAQQVGSNFLNLRNLGTSRTLVLVDGRRHIAGYPGSAAVDVNTIPTDLVERVDILTGGVSAIYGADGVSGVVNFILKDDFEGLRVRGQAGISQRGDAGNRYVAATWGKNFMDGRGNVTLAYEYNIQDRFSQSKRLNRGLTGPSYRMVRNPADHPDDPNVPDYIPLNNLKWADSSPGGAIDLDLDYVPDFTGEGTPYDRGLIVGSTTQGGSGTPTETYFGDNLPYLQRHIGNILTKFEVSPALQLYAQGKYVHSDALTFVQPTYDFLTLLKPDNAYLAQRFGPNAAPNCLFGPVCGALFSRDNLDFGIRNYSLKRDLWRGVVGAKGDLSPNLHYDVSYVYGQTTQRGTNRNDRYTDRYLAALDAVVDPATGQITCRINLPGVNTIDGFTYTGLSLLGPAGTYNSIAPITFKKGECVPLNILGSGSPSQAALDFVTVDHSDYAKIKQNVVSASLSGDTGSFFNLPGGPVGFALGAEYRKESSYYQPSDVSQQFVDLGGGLQSGLLIDNAPARIEQGSFDVKEVFGEVSLPLLSDRPFFYDLRLGAAVRFSDYSTIGSTTTWKVDGSWAPVRDIAFRGTYSRAVRAPNISELFAGGSGTYEFIDDPCGIDRLAEGTSSRAANCQQALTALGIDQATFDPASDAISPQNSSILGFQSGNPNLNAETAKTWTAGVVLRPSFLRNFYFSADWYDIRLKQAIQYSTAQDLVDLCYDQPTLDNQYCKAITRSPVNGYIAGFTEVPQNVASFQTAGLDVAMNYKFTPSPTWGTFSLRAVGNYLDKLSFVPSLGADPKNELLSAAYPAPRYSGNLDLTWEKGPFTLNYGVNYFSKTRRATEEQARANPDYYAPEYMFYKAHWQHDLYASVNVEDRFTFYGGVNNLFDAAPDVASIAYPNDPTGRFFYVGVKAKIY